MTPSTVPGGPTPATGRKAVEVWVGVDTHRDINVAAALDERGRKLGELVVPTTAGNRELRSWATTLGKDVRGFAVEGTGSYGASLTRFLQDVGEFVIGASRPARRSDRQRRREHGKTDTMDAHRAARALLAEELNIAPKHRNGNVEALSVLLLVKRGAIKARTQAVNGMRAILTSAPDRLRDELRNVTMDQLIDRCARLRMAGEGSLAATTKASLRHLARRCRTLTEEIKEVDAEIQRLVLATAPNLLSLVGVGPGFAAVLLATAGENPGRMRSEVSFAHMTGVAPLPTGSGLTSGRHRLNKGGDRQVNSALWRIVTVRMRVDERTKGYVERRTAEGLGKKEIIRCLKRYVAREIYRELIAAASCAL